MAKEREELEVLACVVHVVLAVLHWLAFLFNWRRGNVTDVAIHAVVGVYDTVSAVKHARAAVKDDG